MAFEGLSEKLQAFTKKLRGKARITESELNEMLREVKLALLEADVNYKVVKEFINSIHDKALGQDVLKSLTPGQQVVKIVKDELVDLLGGIDSKITFTPNPPTVIMLVGLQGSGKTTTIKMMSTLIMPTDGEIKVLGYDTKKDYMKIREKLNVSPQETAIAPNLSVKENLEFMAGVYKIKDKDIKINELIKMFKLEEVLKQKAKTLSGGWQRKVSIAIALINNPQILFLDEPTLGLDVIARKELWKVIESLKGKVTIILTTHYMEEAESLSDRIAIMNKGNIVQIGTAKELIEKTGAKNFEDAFVKIATGGEL